MKRTLALAFLCLSAGVSLMANPLRISGSTTVNPVAADAAEVLRDEKKLSITVDTQGGSSGGISGVGEKRTDIGMSSKALSEEDRKKFPKTDFVATRIGEDAVALVVSPDVWKGGMQSITKPQARDLYEKKVTNWKQLGGPDRRVVFFNKEPGRGTWEVFAKWLYGDPKNAPDVDHPEVGANEEALNKVASTPGAVSQLSFAWVAQGGRAYAVGIRSEDGSVTAPTAANIAAGEYPMSRPLLLVTDGKPSGEAALFVDFILSPRGQGLVRKHGYLRLSDLR